MNCGQNSHRNSGILLLATLASIQIAQGLDDDQIELLAAFFGVLGDNLSLLIAPPPGGTCAKKERDAEI